MSAMSNPVYDIHSPEYKPSNVRVTLVEGTDKYVVLDFDGHVMTNPTSFDKAREIQKGRQATIKGALTRRANKAKAAK